MPLLPGRASPPPALPLRTVLLAGIGAMLVQFPAIRLLVDLIYGGNGRAAGPVAFLVLVLLLPSCLGLLWIWFFAVWDEPGGWARLGFRPGVGQWQRWASYAGLGSVLLGIAVVSLSSPWLGLPSGPPLPITPPRGAMGGVYVPLLLLGAAVLAPLVEELIFRGLLYGWLRRHLPIGLSVTIAALAHAAIHFDGPAVPALTAIFILFGLLYEATGTLWAPIIAHALHNGVVIALALLQVGGSGAA